MRLYIPALGDKIRLIQDWTATINIDYRNRSFLELMLGKIDFIDWHGDRFITIPANTILTVDRIYIRKGANNYDSITFNIHQGLNPHMPKGKKRFWVKLNMANTIEYEPFVET